jgi:hypothetical protein
VVPKQYQEFLDVFDKTKSEQFPLNKEWDHEIQLKEGFKPQSTKTYPLSPMEQVELDKFLEGNLQKGYIYLSKSSQMASFFFVDKKDGKLRPVQDYHYLNLWTEKNAYSLPLIPELIDKLKGSKIFSKMDLCWGFNNFHIKEGDQWNSAAFKTNRGSSQPHVIFFKLLNSPETFQTTMNSILQDLINNNVVVVCMDHILIYTEDLKHH